MLRSISKQSGKTVESVLKKKRKAVVGFKEGFKQGSFPVRKRTGTLRIWRAREREPIYGGLGQCPQRGPGAEPLVRG